MPFTLKVLRVTDIQKVIQDAESAPQICRRILELITYHLTWAHCPELDAYLFQVSSDSFSDFGKLHYLMFIDKRWHEFVVEPFGNHTFLKAPSEKNGLDISLRERFIEAISVYGRNGSGPKGDFCGANQEPFPLVPQFAEYGTQRP